MKVKIEDLVRKVALMMGETPQAMSAEGECETATLAGRIALEIESKAAEAVLATPRERISGWTRLDGKGIYAMEDGSAMLPLPDDFLMLLTLRLAGWQRPVTDVLLPGSPKGLLRHSRPEAAGGQPSRPAAMLTACSSGNALRLWGRHSAPPRIEEAWYLPTPRTDDSGFIEIPPAAIPLLLRLAAEGCQQLPD